MEHTIHDHKVPCDDLWRHEDNDDWDDEDDDEYWDEEPTSPEEMADPACIECGGTGGWMAYVEGVEELAWVMCPCTGED